MMDGWGLVKPDSNLNTSYYKLGDDLLKDTYRDVQFQFPVMIFIK